HKARTGGSGTIPYYETQGLKKIRSYSKWHLVIKFWSSSHHLEEQLPQKIIHCFPQKQVLQKM
ncbi:MAG: hypothetical protein K2P98_02260, partial [Neisseriaceae bacterium]|nr:hypothetical protein [Neisseriaceae bacterium]